MLKKMRKLLSIIGGKGEDVMYSDLNKFGFEREGSLYVVEDDVSGNKITIDPETNTVTLTAIGMDEGYTYTVYNEEHLRMVLYTVMPTRMINKSVKRQ